MSWEREREGRSLSIKEAVCSLTLNLVIIEMKGFFPLSLSSLSLTTGLEACACMGREAVDRTHSTPLDPVQFLPLSLPTQSLLPQGVKREEDRDSGEAKVYPCFLFFFADLFYSSDGYHTRGMI